LVAIGVVFLVFLEAWYFVIYSRPITPQNVVIAIVLASVFLAIAERMIHR
jgi:hypothetical protein